MGAPAPTYQDVTYGNTGHAEVVRIEFDPKQITYNNLLTVFFATHDPTSLNKQGQDEGMQYRSIILYYSEEQKKEAEEFIKSINDSHPGGTPVVTELQKLTYFYKAEEEHKNYYEKNSSTSYCQVVINPKLEMVQKEFADMLKKIL
jgi:peptide-methionine (S)-S-oxide reductase